MRSCAGRHRLWRFARSRGALYALGAAVASGACATARPEVPIPPPRTAATTAERPHADSVARPAKSPVSVVTGDIRFLGGGGSRAELGATVVYLQPRGGARSTSEEPATPLRIITRSEAFAPPIQIAHPVQPIILENRGPVVHRLFSGDLGAERTFELPPGARSEPFRLRRRGAVRFYCSLHSDETFVIFSEEAVHVAIVSDAGEYRFGPVAPGRYTLAIWSERVSGPVRDVLVDGYSRRLEPIWLDPDRLRP